jgi:hypothetical protein
MKDLEKSKFIMSRAEDMPPMSDEEKVEWFKALIGEERQTFMQTLQNYSDFIDPDYIIGCYLLLEKTEKSAVEQADSSPNVGQA